MNKRARTNLESETVCTRERIVYALKCRKGNFNCEYVCVHKVRTKCNWYLWF